MQRTDHLLGKLEASGSIDKSSFCGVVDMKILLKWAQNIKDILSIHKLFQRFFLKRAKKWARVRVESRKGLLRAIILEVCGYNLVERDKIMVLERGDDSCWRRDGPETL